MKSVHCLIKIFTLCISLFPILSQAFESKVKGFIAIDVLNLEKQEDQVQEATTGIGTIDLKYYATHEKFRFKLKLDLDDTSLDEANRLFEEAQATYVLSPELSLFGGKGKAAFHRMHYGVISSHYIDGGTTLSSTGHSLRDLDNRLILGFRYGSYPSGFRNTFTFYGNSENPELDENGDIVTDETYGTEVVQANDGFSTKNQRGLANKFEFFPGRGIELSLSLLYYYADWNPKETYALDFGGEIESDSLSYWWEYVYAKVSTNPYNRYASEDQDEHLASFGLEKNLTSLMNLLLNFEYAFVDSQKHSEQDANGNPRGNDGAIYETTSYKGEVGIKFKLDKSAFFTLGAAMEYQEVDASHPTDTNFDDSGIDGTSYAYKIGSNLAFWF